MLKLVSIGAAGTAVLGTALGVLASRAPSEFERRIEASQAIAEAKPLLQRLSLDVPNVTREPAAGAAMTPAVALGAAPPPFLAARTADDAGRALECLTAAVYHEARSEGVDGQRAVAQVVLNRVRDRAFPSSVCGVVYQGSNRSTGCQFTFTCDGSLLRSRNPGAWERARAVAAAALDGAVYAPVGSATHYHANYVSPWWAPSLARIGAVGSHIFYRWPGALGRALAFRQAYAGTEPGAVAPAVQFQPRPAIATATLTLSGGTGVRVHRIGADEPTGTAAGRMTTSSGVRVHRRSGTEELGTAGGSASTVYAVEGAVVGSETDTI